MVLKILAVTDVIGMKIYTDDGNYIGVIEEANLSGNKVDSWRVKVSKESNLYVFLGGARGLVIPHQYVKAFGEVVIISKNALPAAEEIKISEEEVK